MTSVEAMAAYRPRGGTRRWPRVDTMKLLPVYVVAVAVAEFLVVAGQPLAAILVDGAVLIALLNQHAFSRSEISGRDAGVTAAALPALAVVAVLRIASVTLPLMEIPEIYRYVAVCPPVLAAAMLAMRETRISLAQAGLRFSGWGAQATIFALGLPLSLVAFVIASPASPGGAADGGALVVMQAVLLGGVGATEELVFRGLIQTAFRGVLGLTGLTWSTLLFALVYCGAGSLGFVAFMAAVGLVFGVCVARTGSIVGVAGAHGLLVSCLLIVWPQVLAG